jgi:hypothetical protein
MFEQRRKRSELRDEALQYLVESVLDRSDITSAALVAVPAEGRARIVAGAGRAREVVRLGRVASDVVRGDVESLAEEEDVIARAIEVGDETLILAAVGARVRRMPEAAAAIARICATTA